jgi:hypothetical protein
MTNTKLEQLRPGMCVILRHPTGGQYVRQELGGESHSTHVRVRVVIRDGDTYNRQGESGVIIGEHRANYPWVLDANRFLICHKHPPDHTWPPPAR